MLLFKNLAHVVQDSETVLENTDVLVEENRIAKIGKVDSASLPENAKVIDGTGKILMPGFVSAHTHLYQSMLKGMRDDLGLVPWCEQVTFPFADIIHKEERERDNTELNYCYGALGGIEMVRSGTTSFVDFDILTDSVFEAWQQLGVRAVGGIQAVDRWIPKALVGQLDAKKREILHIVQTWHNKGILKVAMAPSTPFACTEEFLAWIRGVAEEYGMQLYMHVSETAWEVKEAKRDYGDTPLAYLEKLDYLSGPRLAAVHCVHLTQEEVEIAKKRKVCVVYNPKSNAKLGSGVAPIPDYLREGLLVTLANDGPASNDLLDMFEEMRFGALLQKATRQSPACIGAKDLFKMATENGAEMLGLDAGVVMEGKLADLVLLDPMSAHMEPTHDIIQSIVYCGKSENVDTVVIDGKVVLEHKTLATMDEAALLKRATALAKEKQQGLQGQRIAAE